MIGHYGIPDASVVFLLLLLFFAPSGLGEGCIWEHSPFPTTDQSYRVKTLKDWMLLDYPVSVPTNLKPDEFCQKLWDLHFIHKALVRMTKVSGKNLTKAIQILMNITNFVTGCKIKEDDCIQFEQRNVSQFLDSIPSLFTAVRQQMESFDEDEKKDFSNCTIVQCHLDYFTTPVTKQAEQRTEEGRFFTTIDVRETARNSSQAATSRKHYWWLILLPTGLLLIAFVAGTRLQCRQQSQNLPFEPPELL